jgi:hypothetical protein
MSPEDTQNQEIYMAQGYSRTYPRFTNAIYANISISSSGDNVVIAGVANQTIRILKLVLGAASTVTAKLCDGVIAGSPPSLDTGTVKGTLQLGSLALSMEEDPMILTTGNEFNINLGSGVSVTGMVAYVQD